MCVYIWHIWHVSAGLSVQCSYSVQACVSMCMCPWAFCVQHALDACVCECGYVPQCTGAHVSKATSVTVWFLVSR